MTQTITSDQEDELDPEKSDSGRGVDLVGYIDGDYTVIKRWPWPLKAGRRGRYWYCKCKCGRVERLSTRAILESGAHKCRHLVALTDREEEIARLIAKGMTNRQIARELVISPNTVKIHLNNIYYKFDLSSRYELIVLVMDKVNAERPPGGIEPD
jgi:DNA-binding CsgD family transcriptional regulator